LIDWRHKQYIKNQLAGPEEEAVEIFPAESRLIDGANQFHLWGAFGSPVPHGWTEGRDVSEVDGPSKCVQRPFEIRPDDLKVVDGAQMDRITEHFKRTGEVLKEADDYLTRKVERHVGCKVPGVSD
jgi:hypothetical protein